MRLVSPSLSTKENGNKPLVIISQMLCVMCSIRTRFNGLSIFYFAFYVRIKCLCGKILCDDSVDAITTITLISRY